MLAEQFRKQAIAAIEAGNPLVIEMLPESEDLGQENVLDVGMRGRVTGIRIDTGFGDDPMYMLSIDLSDFENYNRPYERPNWFFSGMDRGLGTARQTGNWPKNNIDELWFGSKENLARYIKIIGDEPTELFTEYTKSGFEGGYIEWLELQVENLRRLVRDKDNYIQDIIAKEPLQLRDR